MGRISSLFSLYDGGQNVPWVIPISLFTCKFKYTAACTDKTLPRSFLTLVLLTSISHILGCVVRFCLAPNLNLCTGEAAKMNSQHFKSAVRERERLRTRRVAGGGAVFCSTICFVFSSLSLRRSFINSAIVLFRFFFIFFNFTNSFFLFLFF